MSPRRAPLLPLLALFAACSSSEKAPEAASPTKQESVKPGINEKFLDPKLAVDEWVERFEGESREVYRERRALAAALGLEPGQSIADIGAGTGLFEPFFAAAVGEEGKVYALDIAPAFVQLIKERAAERSLTQIEARVCAEDSVGLPAGSVDAAFVCDTYHHFEYPKATLASIHAALKSGGILLVVDFERVPGVSKPWLLKHVRAGKSVFRSEIEAAGFELVEEVSISGLKENYVLRFRKKG